MGRASRRVRVNEPIVARLAAAVPLADGAHVRVEDGPNGGSQQRRLLLGRRRVGPDGRTVESRMRLVGLGSYPLKSARGLSLATAEAGSTGLLHDRRWMIVDANGRFVSQREDPRLGRIVPEIAGGSLRLTARGLSGTNVPELTLPLAPGNAPPRSTGDGPRTSVTIWGDRIGAHGCGPEADAWISALLGPGHRLVAMPEDAVRPVDPDYAEVGDRVSFADGFPYLLTTTASLDELNRRAGTRLTMDRFRPNLVVDGGEPFDEDHWRRIRIGELVFRVAKPCARCVITTLDPDTQEAGPEPLRTLARFRARGSKVLFGQNLLPDGGGTLRVGAAVEVLERAVLERAVPERDDGPDAS